MVHALQKTVAAVIQAVQHMRKIIIPLPANAVTVWCRQYEVFMFFCKNQRRCLFLYAEVLRLLVKDFCIAFTIDNGDMLKTFDNLLDTRMFPDGFFNIKC